LRICVIVWFPDSSFGIKKMSVKKQCEDDQRQAFKDATRAFL